MFRDSAGVCCDRNHWGNIGEPYGKREGGMGVLGFTAAGLPPKQAALRKANLN